MSDSKECNRHQVSQLFSTSSKRTQSNEPLYCWKRIITLKEQPDFTPKISLFEVPFLGEEVKEYLFKTISGTVVQ